MIEKVELLLIENKLEKAKDTFQNLQNKVKEKRENRRLSYHDFIDFKKLEKIIINELSKQNEFKINSKE